ncbi:MAG: hypothetical protein ACI8Q3_001650, partial [Marinomonas primoryensis]
MPFYAHAKPQHDPLGSDLTAQLILYKQLGYNHKEGPIEMCEP